MNNNGHITLNVNAIRTDGGTQPRAQLDFVIVNDYAEAMAEGAIFPPVSVFYDGSDYWLSDGFHRLMAAMQIGLAEIATDVKPGTLQDAQWHSYSVNQTHGLRRTNEDKRRAVEAALAHPKAATMSSREIAAHCGVSHMTVERARDSICNFVTDERAVSRNGSTYTMNTANIGRTNSSAQPSQVPQYAIPETWEDEDEEELPPPDRHYAVFGEGGTEEHFTIGPDEELAVVKVPHVAQNGGNNEWYTPAEYIEAARVVMGSIELDPASTPEANKVIEAATFYTAEQDGLAQVWRAQTVWMNPPYSQPAINQFCNKLRMAYEDGDIAEALVLVNNATETVWFQNLMLSASAVCFPLARVKFWAPDDRIAAPLQGQAVIYLGDNVETFLRIFSRFGWVARNVVNE